MTRGAAAVANGTGRGGRVVAKATKSFAVHKQAMTGNYDFTAYLLARNRKRSGLNRLVSVIERASGTKPWKRIKATYIYESSAQKTKLYDIYASFFR